MLWRIVKIKCLRIFKDHRIQLSLIIKILIQREMDKKITHKGNKITGQKWKQIKNKNLIIVLINWKV
jgi:hypothetical protein